MKAVPSAGKKPGALSYRPDIDGLRAVAILSVVLFHAFPGRLPGGYAGVDIFFVISGFLISSIIFKGMVNQNFSIVEFYVHRAKRIFPALIIVLMACYCFAWMVLLPDEFKLLGKHIASGAGFVQNLMLWREAGYFDHASELKPLMHLWSLAIEEQFYLLYPLLILLAWRSGLNLLSILLLLLATSFGWDLWLLSKDPTAAFFLPQGRFWELLSGGCLAYLQMFHREKTSRFGMAIILRQHGFSSGFDLNGLTEKLNTVLSCAGLALIALSIALLNKDSLFPGAWALLPVMGAFLLILSGPIAWVNKHILSNRFMLFIGAISYPLYLWHWPLLSFAYIMQGDMPSTVTRVVLLAIAVLLSWLTYRLIERPIRFSEAKGWWKPAFLCLLLSAAGYAGYNAYLRDGLDFRPITKMNLDVRTAVVGVERDRYAEDNCGVSDDGKKFVSFCHESKGVRERYAVWGDSKGDALYWGLVRQAKQDGGWLMLGRYSCAPMVGVRRTSTYSATDYDPAECVRSNELAFQDIMSNSNIKVVVLATAQRILLNASYVADASAESSWQAVISGLTEAVRRLESAGKRVIFVVDNPTLPEAKSCLAPRWTEVPLLNAWLQQKKGNPDCNMSYQKYLHDSQEYRTLVDELHARNPGLLIYNPVPLLCDLKRGVCPIERKGSFLYSYGDHISDYANNMIGRDLIGVLGSPGL
ncbi:acyltransferase [Chromobacterium sp. ATCC 53434]|uniref:acyltransferase family protein n=1 Tax=Chromobacterium sp. (strain ATCC 53434 / SC 14030) TaxID=2059672 RepID=UPI000C7919A7|nr:acyltransferase family protein [Chromobacterium sp. ATCC 53434]AUH52511.1 acyltransferase [Chromobacterium sp. ATCC 53434]